MKTLFKKSIIALAALVSLMTATSCEHYLDMATNSGQSKEYVFEDYDRSARYMDLLYYYMLPNWVLDGKFQGYYGMLESATDMSEYTANYGVTNLAFNVGDWYHSSASSEVAVWGRCYNQIRRAWMFLEHCDEFNNEPEGRKPMMKGECHFMLAYYYFELYRRYGGVPLVTKVLNLDDNYKIPRSPEDSIMTFICSELDEAEKLVPDVWPSDEYGRADKAWVKALRSRALLYAASPLHNPDNDLKKWEAAAEAAKDCIQFCQKSGKYALNADYQKIFMTYFPNQIPEIIVFKRAGVYNHTFKSQLINYEQATPGDEFWGNGSNTPTQNLVDRYPVIKFDADGKAIGTEKFDWNNPEHVKNIYKNRDPRFYYTVLYNGRFWIKREIATWQDGSSYGADKDPKNELFSKTGYYLRKFWPRECKDKNNPGSSRIYGFYIRLGELYLNYAEAMNEAYGPDNGKDWLSAVEAVNVLRSRLVCPATENIVNANDTYYYIKVERDENPDFPVLPDGMPGLLTGMSKDQAREQIQNERVIELAFEDQYFYDILRWKQGPEHIGSPIYGVDVIKNGDNYTYSKAKVEDRLFESRMYYYPIPKTEVYNLGIKQNPGW